MLKTNFTSNLSIRQHRQLQRIYFRLVLINFLICDLILVAECFVSIKICDAKRKPHPPRVFGIPDKQIRRSQLILKENPDDNQQNDRITPAVFSDDNNWLMNQTSLEEGTDAFSYTIPNRNGIKNDNVNGFKVENQATMTEGEFTKPEGSNVIKHPNGEPVIRNGFNGKNGFKVNGDVPPQANGFDTKSLKPTLQNECAKETDRLNRKKEPDDTSTMADVACALPSMANGFEDETLAPTTLKREKSNKVNLVRDPALFDAVARWSELRFQSRQDNDGSIDRKVQSNTANDGNRYFGVLRDGADLQQLRKDVSSVLSEDDIQQIERFWDGMEPTLSYFGNRDEVLKVYKALWVGYTAHNGQRRKSGEPFIIHPVEVALLLSGLKMDSCTVCAGLLHDTVEDTELSFEQVESLFGYTVRSIVEGETKVSKLPKQLAFEGEEGRINNDKQQKQADEQAENLRQMFVAMTDDYRIIIVKLADRLHNMRTLQHMKPHKQIKISRETLDIFAPLAHRMGIWQFKSELEDTAFMYLYPTEYKRLHRRLQQHSEKFKQTLESSKELLQRRLDNDQTLEQQAASVQVTGRTKEIYSLWHKMETKNIHNLDNVMDVVALRVIITPKPNPQTENNNSDLGGPGMESDRGVWLCYHVLGLVQHLHGFQPVPTRVKDYISFPKPNGYQSLHTALILNGQTIEVQIRTSMMHQVAEYGMASHWAYTDGKRRSLSNVNEIYNTPWLSSIKEWQNDRISSRDFVDSVRRELLGKRVFVFLRNGKILNLARGATAIDAAFQIHTEVGLKMHGVEINGRPVPFSYTLKNGDVVSILTGDGKPATEWMRYAKSRSTRSKLRAYFRQQQRNILQDSGRILLQDYLVRYGKLIEKSSRLPTNFTVPVAGSDSFENDLESFLPNSKTLYESVDDLLVAIGKHDDRTMLRSVVCQLFGVPKKVLAVLDDQTQSDDMLISKSSIMPVTSDSIQQTTQRRDALEIYDNTQLPINILPDQSAIGPQNPDFFPSKTSFDNFLSTIGSKLEYADPEHLCPDCLPVYGDAIIGTKIQSKDGKSSEDTSATVHRIGCPHSQRALNQAWAERRGTSANNINAVQSNIVDSVRLRAEQRQRLFQAKSRYANKNANLSSDVKEVPVRLEWFDLDDKDDSSHCNFMAEIVVHCVDRKLLLADCSIVVSDMSEIIKTGSQTQQEYATLVFLVKVDNISHIQALMDALNKIDSVMSVERRFGSELL